MILELAVRTVYTFTIDDKTLDRLLSDNINPGNERKVNIVAYSIFKINEDKTLVKMVVGTDDPNNIHRGGAGGPLNPDENMSNDLQNFQFMQNLKKLNIKYSKKPIIQVFSVDTKGTVGVYRILYRELVRAGITIISSFPGEYVIRIPIMSCKCKDGSINYKQTGSEFFEVPEDQISIAIKSLKKINI